MPIQSARKPLADLVAGMRTSYNQDTLNGAFNWQSHQPSKSNVKYTDYAKLNKQRLKLSVPKHEVCVSPNALQDLSKGKQTLITSPSRPIESE